MSNIAQVNPFFTPTQISGCALWWDAAEYSSFTPANPVRGTSISGWRDKIRGITLSNYNASPTWTSNGINFQNSSYTLSGTTQNLDFTGSTGVTLSQNTTVFIAHAPNLFDNYRAPFTMLAPGTFNTNPSFFIGFQNGSNEGNTVGTFNPSINDWISIQQAGVVNTGAGNRRIDTILSSASNFIWTNGIENTYSIDNRGRGTSVAGTASLGKIGMSASANIQGNRAYDGRIYEVLVYNTNLSFSTIQQVEGYLAWKWGIQNNLPARNPYKNSIIPPLLNPPTTLPIFNQNTSIVSWSPFQIPGCTIWLDAADRTTLSLTGTTVNSWNSKVSSVPLLASSVGGGSIVYSNFNNLPSLYFNGTNTKLTTGSIPSYGTTGTTWLTASVNLTPVVANSTPVDASVVFATAGSTPEKSIRYNFPPQFIIYTFNNGQVRGGRSNNDNGIRGFIDSGPSMYAFVNGVDITETQLSATYQPGVNQAFQLGQWNTGWLLGHIQEVLVYNSALSIPQYQLAEGYLAWKWGFQSSLPRNHPYKNNPPLGNSLAPLARSLATNTVWQPNQISGLNAWFDGADPNGNGVMPRQNTPVSTWVNKRSGGTNATAVGTGASYSSNGLTFATPKYYTTNIQYSTNYSIFLVATNNTSGLSCYFIARNSIGGGRGPTFTQGYTNTTRLQFYEGDGGVFPIIQDPTVSPFLTSVNYTSLGRINLYYNGTNTSNTTSTATYNSAAWDTIGQAGAGVNTGYYNGIMKELIFYNILLTNQQRQNVEGYLAWKWGLQGSLPANHPFKRWPPSP